jgi:hypothetical protein
MSRGSPCEGPQGPRASAAAKEYSIGRVARYGPLVPLVAGALLLILAEFLTVREIRAVTVVPPGGSTSGGSHHGYALAIVGLAMLPMSVGAVLRGARPAAVALLVLSLVAWAIILLVDRPALDDTGLIGRTYDLAEARPGAGFYVETVGAALALVGTATVLVMQRGARPRGRARERRPRTAPESSAPPGGG